MTPITAAETGLAVGTPVTVGTIDAAAEAVSVGVRGPGELMLMYGSTIFIIEVTSQPIRDARLWYAPWLVPGLHASMAGLATSGTLIRWFHDELAPGAGWEELVAAAEASPKGAKGLLCLPHFSGERTPIHDPFAKGVFAGLDLTHTRADLFRAVLEGIASGTAHALDTYREVGAAPRVAYAVGGGTQNAVWLQATSDIGQVTQAVREKTIGASYGDAFLAAVAVGQAAPEDIEAWNPVARTVADRRPSPPTSGSTRSGSSSTPSRDAPTSAVPWEMDRDPADQVPPRSSPRSPPPWMTRRWSPSSRPSRRPAGSCSTAAAARG